MTTTMTSAADPPREPTPAPSLRDLPAPPARRTGWPWTEETPPLPARMPDGGAWPRISIVTPSFRQGEFIEETLRSILLQGYPDLELIVVDGGSTDRTVEVLRAYDPWIAHWVSEPDRGQTHAINKGLARATGEIFAYLNSDDLYLPGALAEAAAAFRAEPEVEAVYGGCVYVDERGADLRTLHGRVEGFPQYLRIWDRLARGEHLTQPEVFCRTRSVVEAGGFREELRSVMDLEMWLRLLSRGAVFRSVAAPLAKFRTYAAQKSSVDPGLELCAVVREYATLPDAPLAPAERDALLRELPRVRAHLLVRAAIAATLVGRYPRAVRYCLHGAAVHPRIAASYPFWAVLAAPLKRVLPSRTVASLRRLLSSAPA